MEFRFIGKHPTACDRVLTVSSQEIKLTCNGSPIGLDRSFRNSVRLRIRLQELLGNKDSKADKQDAMLAAIRSSSMKRAWEIDQAYAAPKRAKIKKPSGLFTYFLSVLQPISDTGNTLVTVLRVQVDQPIKWVRDHADDLAKQAGFASYCALMVSNEKPAEV